MLMFTFNLPHHEKCPCHSGKKYGNCCQPFHDERRNPSPLQLLRARYSAYVLEGVAYIIKTTHPNSPFFNPNLTHWEREIYNFCHDNQFESLIVEDVEHERGGEVAFVTFEAGLRDAKHNETVMTERSEFRYYDDHWLYFNGLEATI